MATGLYTHPEFLKHEMGYHHPECPDRLRAIEDQLIASRIEIVHKNKAARAKSRLSAAIKAMAAA